MWNIILLCETICVILYSNRNKKAIDSEKYAIISIYLILKRGMKMSDGVQSVERALSILEVLANYRDGLGVTDISEKVDLHKSTVYRLLSTLISMDYVIQDKETNRYMTTFKLYELGNKRVESMDILTASKPYTKKLMESLNEVVHLVVRENNKIIYIDKVEANNTIRMASTIGKRSPMYCTSVGKAMLAYFSDEEVEKVWNASNVVKLTPNTIVDYDMFRIELEKVRANGYALDNEENEDGVRCIGAPIFDRNKQIAGAISISGPIFRVSEEKLDIISSEVIKYANLISRELGYTGV